MSSIELKIKLKKPRRMLVKELRKLKDKPIEFESRLKEILKSWANYPPQEATHGFEGFLSVFLKAVSEQLFQRFFQWALSTIIHYRNKFLKV